MDFSRREREVDWISRRSDGICVWVRIGVVLLSVPY